MAEANTVVARMSPLAGEASSGSMSFAGIELAEQKGRAVVQLFARSGKEATVCEALGIVNQPGVASVNEQLTALPLAPGQWILTAASGDDGAFATRLREQLGEDAFVSEQSHGRTIIRVSGENARALMQKGCRLDLHPSVAQPGFCAQTAMAQIGVLVHQVDAQATYDLHVYSGFALSFWHWLTTTSAQFGSLDGKS